MEKPKAIIFTDSGGAIIGAQLHDVQIVLPDWHITVEEFGEQPIAHPADPEDVLALIAWTLGIPEERLLDA